MKNSIEDMWKEGFLNESSLIAPQVNDLYNRKSKHLIDKMIRMFRINYITIIVLSFVVVAVYYSVNAFWQGIVIAILLILTAVYSRHQMKGIKGLDQGATSYDYLRAFHGSLKSSLSKMEKVIRFTYPVYFVLACSAIWVAWNENTELIEKTQQKFPDMTFVGNVPLFALILVGAITLLILIFSDKIYRWDMRLVFGRVFDKLDEIIAEMEKLR